jgi:hypothetical protein
MSTSKNLNFKGTVHLCMYFVTRQGNGNAHRLRNTASQNILAQKSRQLELASLLGRARPILEKKHAEGSLEAGNEGEKAYIGL